MTSPVVLAGLGLALYTFLHKKHKRLASTSGESDPIDNKWVEVCRSLYLSSDRPHHSEFLVAAIITYIDGDGVVRHVGGVNSEVCSVTGSICAERTAALQLRLKASPGPTILGVYITASADTCITPGMLCREFLSEICGPQTPIVMFTPDWQPLNGGSSPRGQLVTHELGALYPHPCLYRGMRRAHLLEAGEQFAAAMAFVDLTKLHDVLGQATGLAPALRLSTARLSSEQAGADWPSTPGSSAIVPSTYLEADVLRLYNRVVDCAASAGPTPESDKLYPVRYAAGALLAGGGMAVARMDVCLEYGCSIDSVTKLAHTLALGASGPASPHGQPVVLMMSDQHGILHAPFAAPRAWLNEYGFGETAVLLHTAEGKLAVVSASSLAPAAPAISL